MIQFIVYVGWMKVAEALLNPLGEDDDDLECNYIIDKNLITGLTLVEQAGTKNPTLSKDVFWNNDHIAPLYSLESAKRSVHPLIGSVSSINYVGKEDTITMIPHKNKLITMDEHAREATIRVVDVSEHNERHKTSQKKQKSNDPDSILWRLRRKYKGSLKKTDNIANIQQQQPPPSMVQIDVHGNEHDASNIRRVSDNYPSYYHNTGKQFMN